jgi:hypothetical protein
MSERLCRVAMEFKERGESMRQKTRSVVLTVMLMGLSAAMAITSVFAQEVLPRPEANFKGTIGQTYKDSTPDKIPLIKAPRVPPTCCSS